MQKLKHTRTVSGSALITALVMGVVFSIIGLTILRLTARGSDIGRRDIEAIKSYWANEGFMRLALRAISLDEGDGKGFPNDPDLTAPQPVVPSKPVVLNGYMFGSNAATVEMYITYLACCRGAYNLTVKSHLINEGLYNITTIDNVVVKSIQRYTFFEDTTAPDPIWWRDFIVHGDFHSNGIVKVADDMLPGKHVELGEATTSGELDPPKNYDGDIYDKGMLVSNDATPAESWFKERFPEYSHVGHIQTDCVSPADPAAEVANKVHDIDTSSFGTFNEVAIYLNGGNVYVYILQNGNWKYVNPPLDSIIRTGKTTTVWANSMAGRRTIVTELGRDIRIGGKITYAGGGADGTSDALALVSGRNIVIPKSFDCVAPTNNPNQHFDFTTTRDTVYACMFAKHGGLTVDSIAAFPHKPKTEKLGTFTVHGCVLVRQDLDKVWEFDDGKFAGLDCIYNRDKRYYNNEVAPPGIPFPKALDEEKSDQFASKFMWVLASGTWHNYLQRE